MFIRKTITQKYAGNGNKYITYRLVRQYRNLAGQSRQETLLNLGSEFSVPEQDWGILCQRIEQLTNNSAALFELELPVALEMEAQRISKLVNERNQSKAIAKIIPVSTDPLAKDYQNVDINSTIDSDVRHVGIENLSYATVCKLGLPEILLACGLNQKQTNIAIASIISRLIVADSERSSHRYLTQDSALDELIGVDFSNLDLNQLYYASDNLLKHKDEIESALYSREKELFNLTEVITLFDITNTYFEGHPQHKAAHKGRSKEKRSDCELISLGLLLDSSGFPKKSKILAGNISEPATLKEMLAYLNDSRPTVIIDAGIATKENLAYLAAEGYSYIVVKRDSDLVMPNDDSSIVVKDTTHNKVTVSLVKQTDREVNLYCHSTAKEAKATEFTDKTAQRFETELAKLANNLPGCDLYTDFSEYTGQSSAVILNDGQVLTNQPQEPIRLLIKLSVLNDPILAKQFRLDSELSRIMQTNDALLKAVASYNGQVRKHTKLQSKLRTAFSHRVQATKKNVTRSFEDILVKVGRLKQQYKSVSHLYDIEIIPDNHKYYALALNYTKDEKQLKNKQSGIYCLSSNRVDLSAAQLWETYTMLTEIEAAFRSLKSELGMRPVYHQLEHRIDGHIFITLLAYHVLHTIRYVLKQHGINNSWDGIRNIMAMQFRTTTTMDLEKGGVVKVRKTSRATAEQAHIYRILGIDAHPCKLVKTYSHPLKASVG